MTKRAFVIMPFGAKFDTVYQKIISPPLQEAGYQVDRADSLSDRSNIIKKIIKGMNRADIIIADLTDNNPNVFYELGICHAMNKKVIMITQNIDVMPFDLKQYVLESYTKDIDDVDKFHKSLQSLLQSISEDNIIFENPVSDFWSNNTTEDIIVSDSDRSGIEKIKEINHDDDEGILDARIKLDNSAEAIVEVTEKFPRIFTELTHQLISHSEQLEKASKAKSTVLMHRAVSAASETVSNFADQMALSNDTLEYQAKQFNFSLSKIKSLTSNISNDDLIASAHLDTSMNQAIENAKELKASIQSTKDMNISKLYNRASTKAIDQMSRIIAVMESIRDTVADQYRSTEVPEQVD
ncbi:hypothetical protein [Deinococcus xianganensis]|uniref:Nucleoside 2-deoxyribosyltransferase n=1 Tax=Deinococcus xianganensis TaxID=1507289 RepID=A0A6I4YJJ2_9DEIO|nr:hypothetical protein [Deinococcus xianganensis]MXV20131.1 hypothetical protein [Deinococcus xianganensis]